jgi:hypothetical protein
MLFNETLSSKGLLENSFVAAAILKTDAVSHFLPNSNIHFLSHTPGD